MDSAGSTERYDDLSLVGHTRGPDAPFIPFGKAQIHQSIARRFEQQVACHPRRPAVRSGMQALSYDALNRAANRVAHSLAPYMDNERVPVAILLDQGIAQITATLAVLKAGGFYVPLDPANPLSRNRHMLEDSLSELIVTDARNLALARELTHPGQRLVTVDDIEQSGSDHNLSLEIGPDALAYILYTSGSTGRPKGVVQNQRNVLHNVMRHTNAFRIGVQDRQSLLYTPSVYGGQRDMFNALLNGASLHIYPAKTLGVARLSQWIEDNEITIYCSVATLFRQWVNTLPAGGRLETLRLIKLGGEASYVRDVEAYQRHFPSGCLMHCGLGATETGLARNFFVDKTTRLPGTTVPLGYPVEDLEILLLDETGVPLTDTGLGEIAVKSAYIALGYWRNPELTETVFQSVGANPDQRIYRTGDLGVLRPDGCLEHRGRKDFQVKIRGNRVELPEVESALLRQDSVKEAVVLARTDENTKQRLFAYVVPADPHLQSTGALRMGLETALPDYMIPSVFVWLDALPLLPNGKVDRQSLLGIRPESSTTGASYTAPRTPVERKLVQIWEKALGRRGHVGIHGNFFELGGDSLAAVEITSEIDRHYDRILPLAVLFEAKTVARLASVLEQDMRLRPWSPLVPIQPEGSSPPLFCIHPAGGNVLGYVEFARLLGAEQPVYGIQAYGVIEGQEPHDHMETMAAEYITVMRQVQPEGPYYLGGESFGGLVAYEMARQLHAQGETVAFLFIGDSWPRRRKGSDRLGYARAAVTFPLTLSLKEWLGLVQRRLSGVNYYEVKVRRYKFAEALRRRNSQAHRKASGNYVPGPYPGSLTLFRASIAPYRVRRLEHYCGGPDMGWSDLVRGEVEVQSMPGTHREMMHGDHAPGFAATLTACIARARLRLRPSDI